MEFAWIVVRLLVHLALILVLIFLLMWANTLMYSRRPFAVFGKVVEALEKEFGPLHLDRKAPWLLNNERLLKGVTAVFFMVGSLVFLHCVFTKVPHAVGLLLFPIYLLKSASLVREYFRNSY